MAENNGEAKENQIKKHSAERAMARSLVMQCFAAGGHDCIAECGINLYANSFAGYGFNNGSSRGLIEEPSLYAAHIAASLRCCRVFFDDDVDVNDDDDDVDNHNDNDDNGNDKE